MSGTYDYRAMMRPIIALIKQATGSPVVEASFAGKQPGYPFLSYEPLNPYTPVSVDVVDHEIFESSWSIDAYAEDVFEALNTAQAAAKSLRTQAAAFKLDDAGIYLIDETDASSRDVSFAVQEQHRVGFDIHLRVQDQFEDAVETIDSLSLNGFNLPKNNKEA